MNAFKISIQKGQKTMVEQEKLIALVKETASLYYEKSFSLRDKNNDLADPVTSNDIFIQKMLQKELLALLPGSGFLGEENEAPIPSERYCWVVDPIDGTANYARNIDENGISVALLDGDEPVEALLYFPRKKMLLFGAKGEGSYLALGAEKPKKLSVSNRPLNDAIVCFAMPMRNKNLSAPMNELFLDLFLNVNDFRRFGACSLELAYLAMGAIDAYFELTIHSWDIAAGSLLIQEAGGVLLTQEGHKPNYRSRKSMTIIAASSLTNFASIQALAKRHIQEFPVL